MGERDRKITSGEARLIGAILGIGTAIALNSGIAPKILNNIDNFIEETTISTNVNDYPIETTIKGGIVCYTKRYPTLSNGLQTTTLRDAFCPEGVNGQTRFVELSIPTETITQYPRKK